MGVVANKVISAGSENLLLQSINTQETFYQTGKRIQQVTKQPSSLTNKFRRFSKCDQFAEQINGLNNLKFHKAAFDGALIGLCILGTAPTASVKLRINPINQSILLAGAIAGLSSSSSRLNSKEETGQQTSSVFSIQDLIGDMKTDEHQNQNMAQQRITNSQDQEFDEKIRQNGQKEQDQENASDLSIVNEKQQKKKAKLDRKKISKSLQEMFTMSKEQVTGEQNLETLSEEQLSQLEAKKVTNFNFKPILTAAAVTGFSMLTQVAAAAEVVTQEMIDAMTPEELAAHKLILKKTKSFRMVLIGSFFFSGYQLYCIAAAKFDPAWLWLNFRKMIFMGPRAGYEFFDFETPPNMVQQIEKDENGRFPLKVMGKEKLNDNVLQFTLKLPESGWISGGWPGAHFYWYATIDGKEIQRKYSQISQVCCRGKAIFAVKIYRENPKFPGGGKFTQHLEKNVHVGDTIYCGGPVGSICYRGWGRFDYMKKPLKNKKMRVGLIAAGSGLTPMYAIAQASCLADDGVDITFLFANKTKDDIFCKRQLQGLVDMSEESGRFKLFYTLDEHDPQAHGEWDGLTGRVSYDMFKKCGFPEPADDVLILTCGPVPFEKAIGKFLGENGYVKGEHYV